MSLLLDTHTLAWFCLGTGLPPDVRSLIEDYRGEVFVSAISAYEMALKVRLGLWQDARPLVESFGSILADGHFETLPVTDAHALHAGSLPVFHRDPFDRIIVAQALAEQLRIVSKDGQLGLLGATVVWGSEATP